MNTFGRIFRVTTWGESHGIAIGCVVDGCPSGLEISEREIQEELDRRKPGQSSVTTSRKEEDRIEILSGVFDPNQNLKVLIGHKNLPKANFSCGKTAGSPISMMIRNTDIDSSRYELMKDKPRPGHADLTWRQKFGISDWRGGGRASGRETAMRVAAGAIARKLLSRFGIGVLAYSKEIAGINADGLDSVNNINPKKVEEIRKGIYSNPVRTINSKKAEDMEKAIINAKSEKDSVGGIIEAIAFGVPPGLGEPVFGKLDSDIASGMMGIPAVKGVEIGKGFELAGMTGSESNDEFFTNGRKIYTKTNNCGGILGGISNGMPIVLRVVVKPTSSIGKLQHTVDLRNMEETTIEIFGPELATKSLIGPKNFQRKFSWRHDPCIVPRAVPVVEAMLALVLADHSIASGFIPRRL